MQCRTVKPNAAIAILCLAVTSIVSVAQARGTATRPAEPPELHVHLEELLKRASRAAELHDEDPPLRYKTTKEIGELTRENPEACIPVLLRRADKGTGIRSNSAAMRLVALEALGHAGADAKRAIPVLAERLSEAMRDPPESSLGSPSRKMVVALAKTLSRIGPHDESVIPVLITALSHEECYVRGHAVSLLRDFGGRAAPAKEALIGVLHQYPWISHPARAALREIAPEDARLQHQLDVLDFCDLAWTPEIMLWPFTLSLQLITVACLAWGALAIRGRRRRILLCAVGLLALPIPLSEMWRHDALAFEGGGPAYLILNLIHVLGALAVAAGVTESITPSDNREGADVSAAPSARHAVSILPSVFLIWSLPLLSTPLAAAVRSGGTGSVAPPPGYKWVGTPPMESGCYVIVFALTMFIVMLVAAGRAQRASKAVGRHLVIPNIFLAILALLLNIIVPALEML